MNWNDINLNSSYERAQPIIDSLSFDTLLLEINCNIKDINEAAIRAQFEEDLRNRIINAKEVFEANLNNIVSEAINYRSI